jgi:putative NIF3 family GTP cyclohydrolase 1 type 2
MPERITAQQVVDRIQKNLGTPWKTPSLDVFMAGDPNTPVTGIATAFAPTLDVLRRAAAAGKNMIIARESAFYRSANPARDLATDSTYLFKRDFISKNNLVIWRFCDNWETREVDGQLRGLAMALGWDKYHKPDRKAGKQPYHPGDAFFDLPGTSLGAMARSVQVRLKIQGLRVIGDPRTRVSKAALTNGLMPVPSLQEILKEPDVSLVVTGEPVEWEASPYFEDVIASGRKMGMIILGQEASEEPGSGEVANWLRSFLPQLPIEWVSAGEPFWVLT